MVVEQRIGRIDRLGQEAPVITILSLVLSKTIEDRILYRLYERIGVLEETIGEIEPILGEQIEKLAITALRNELTAEEQERQADQAAEAFLHEQHQGNTLQKEADRLIAGDQAFLDGIQSLIGERKVPTPTELYWFLGGFLDQRYPGNLFPKEVVEGVADVTLHSRLATDLLRELDNTPDLRRIASRVQQGTFPATVDADAHLRRPQSEFISIHHPFVRLAGAFLERDTEHLHRAFRLRLRGKEDEPEGAYLLTILEFTISGNRARTEIVPIFWNLRAGRPVEPHAGRGLFIRLLDTGERMEEERFISDAVIELGISPENS